MTKSDWMDLAVLERKKYNYLSEVMDLSRQLGEALDRNDDVSVRMLVSMRQDPILGLEEVKRAIEAKQNSMTPEDRERLATPAGEAAPQEAEETAYWNQAGSARRLLERILELDRQLSRRLAGNDSFYGR
ncbi:MAG: hypothetical protein HFF52_07755 [Lawsonibacter sp.]|nr:hypothetical protein [Lawsonibacter sp.]